MLNLFTAACRIAKSLPLAQMRAPFTKLESLEDSKRIKILYCGNFGNMHESKTLFDAWKSGIDDSFQFLFHCSGPKRKELELFKNKMRLR